MDKITFENRVAAVTGAGGGLGGTYALELARRGCKIIVNDLGGARDGSGAGQTAADRVVQKIRAGGGEATASYDGVHSEEGGEAIVECALKTYGKLDILIHNAGIIRDRSFAKMTADEWRSVLDVHLNGAYNVANPAFKAMKEKRYGRILFTTSTSGLFGNFGQANYGAAKMGQAGLMNVLAIEGAKYGILANAVSPLAMTRMTEDLPRSGQPEISRDPEHVTPAAVYLVSENCDVSGTIIHASFGFFGRIHVAYNDGVFLGQTPVSVEKFAENWREITDMESPRIQGEKPFLQWAAEKATPDTK